MTYKEVMKIPFNKWNSMSRQELAKATRVLADVARKRFNRMEQSPYRTREFTRMVSKLASKGRIEVTSTMKNGQVITARHGALFRTTGNVGQLKSEFVMLKEFLGAGSTINEGKRQFSRMLRDIGIDKDYVFNPKTGLYTDIYSGKSYTQAEVLGVHRVINAAIERLYDLRPDLIFTMPPSDLEVEANSYVLQNPGASIDSVLAHLENYIDELEDERRAKEAEIMARFAGKEYYPGNR